MVIDERAQRWLNVPHSESPERIGRSYEVLQKSGVLKTLAEIPAREATDHDLALVHKVDFIKRIRAACAREEYLCVGPEARVGPGSLQPALLSAGGLLSAVDWVLSGAGTTAYVLTRPPGHHASASQAMGFCLFNAVAIGARYAQHQGVGRVAIVDWDVHHGNGSQAIFYEDPTVFFISLHQDGLYPTDSGRLSETGSAGGLGYTVNIPLPAGAGDHGYLHAFERVVAPALRHFKPELVFISAGQDAAASDPLGRMSLTAEGFRRMTRQVKTVAVDVCNGRVIAYQEGGYSADHMPFCVLAIVEELADLEPQLHRDPLELDVPTSLGPTEAAAVSEAVAAHNRWLG